MLFSYNWLQTFFDKKLPEPNELARLIIKHVFEVEGIEKTAKDTIFDISILSNRPDCFSHIGIAREISAILGLKLVLPKNKAVKSKNLAAVKSLVEVKIEAPDACLRYTAKAITGVKVGPSPKWIQERLEACGLRSINNIVDATNYAMLETGQPLHAFDWDKLQNCQSKSKTKKIIVRYAAEGETIDVLGEKKYRLTPAMLLIADETGPLAIAGIKGGKRAEISGGTKTIIIESANFNSRKIRNASRNLGLQTDASLKYEHVLDPGGTAEVAERVSDLIVQIGGGQVLAGAVDRYPQPVRPKKIVLGLERAENMLGTDIQSAQAKKKLELLGFSVRKGAGLSLEVVSPTRRTDISVAEDLIEEIGRIIGYDKVTPELPSAAVLPAVRNYEWLWKNSAKDLLAACGYSETRNYSFISKTDAEIFGFAEKELLEVKNPVNADLRFLRPSLLINLLKNIAANPEKKSLRQFEIGKVFAPDKKMEPVMIAGMDKGGDFFKVKGEIERLFHSLGISDFAAMPVEVKDKEIGQSLLDPSRRAKILAGKAVIGILGYVSRNICDKTGIEPLAVFELDLDAMARTATQRIDNKPLSIYPEATRDISVDMPISTLSAQVADAVRKADSPRLINGIEIPDAPYVSGEKKNILFKFHLHSDKKTLDSKEISDWQEKTIAAIEKNPEWKVRKQA
jgi:phenylalanyl-tRNA synthetase beta chain